MKTLKVILLAGLLTLGQVFAQSTTAPKWRLEWNTNPETDVIAYGVYNAPTQNGTYTLVATVTEVSGTTQSWLVPVGVHDGTWFRVTALNDAGLESDPSASLRVPVKPGAPGGVKLIRIP